MKTTKPLSENHLFRRVYRTGKSYVTPYVAVYYKKNGLPYNRLGITATKKIGNAVQRNRARRIIKEAYRLSEPDLINNHDIVIVARKKAVFAKMQDIKKSLRKLKATESQKKAK